MLLLALLFIHCQGLPNIILFITDDQDLILGGMAPMSKLKLLVGNQGVTFSNAMVTTPLCCPSRTAILTGRYPHNGGARGNGISHGCGSNGWINGAEKQTFAAYAKKAGYITGYAGKYLNRYGSPGTLGCDPNSTAKCGRVPSGWDNWLGFSGDSTHPYYNYWASQNGTIIEHGNDYYKDYSTNVVRNWTLSFLHNTSQWYPHRPFLLVNSFHAPHRPCVPAPQYSSAFRQRKHIVKRLPWFNNHDKGCGKHWLVNVTAPSLPDPKTGRYWCDDLLIQRWQTLLSVDDAIEDVIKALHATHQLVNTHIFYISDNGFNLCTYCRDDKRLPYDNNIRVPLLVSGPGILKGVELPDLVSNIDIAPTILDIMGVDIPSFMDGVSLLPRLTGKPGYVRENLLIEYFGEYDRGCDGILACKAPSWREIPDSKNNTYLCLRHLNPSDPSSETNNSMFCEFKDLVNFKEYYNLNTDPYQMYNRILSLPLAQVANFSARVQGLGRLKPAIKVLKQFFGNTSYVLTNDDLIVQVSGRGRGTFTATGTVILYGVINLKKNRTQIIGKGTLMGGNATVRIRHEAHLLNGPRIVRVLYSGDTRYRMGKITIRMTFYSFPRNGVHVISDRFRVGQNVTYYGVHWSRANGFRGPPPSPPSPSPSPQDALPWSPLSRFYGWTSFAPASSSSSSSLVRPWDECAVRFPLLIRRDRLAHDRNLEYIGVVVLSDIVHSQRAEQSDETQKEKKRDEELTAIAVNVAVIKTTNYLFGRGEMTALLCS